jgi:RNA 3'-terminal phosphate cyclase (ATP)
VAERQIEGARKRVSFDEQHVLYVPAYSTGTAVFIGARFEHAVLGASALGALGKPAEKVGLEAAELLREEVDSPGVLDRHMADQILPYMALSDGDSTIAPAAITDHCRTNMWLIEKFLPVHFEVAPSGAHITCRHT